MDSNEHSRVGIGNTIETGFVRAIGSKLQIIFHHVVNTDSLISHLRPAYCKNWRIPLSFKYDQFGGGWSGAIADHAP